MASTAAAYQTIIDAIDTLIAAKLAGEDVARFKLGEEEIHKYDLLKLTEMRKMYQKLLEEVSSGTEYWDVLHDGVDSLSGRDLTVSIGDIED